MRQILTIVTMAALWGGMVSSGWTEDSKTAKPSNNGKAEASTKSSTTDLRAEIHRTLAALNETRSAEKPDQAKLEELTRKLQQLRGELRTQSAAAGGNAVGAWVPPCGGPGMGWGRGAGWGGAGIGAGYGCGGGHGWGGGAGRGQGFGPGAGAGQAPGGAAFVDQDKNGVCDHYELRHAAQK